MRTPDPWSIPRAPFTLTHVRPQGLTPNRLQTAMKSGDIVRLRRGVYLAADAVPIAPNELHVLRAIAEQLVVPDLVASHETAALAHGLPLPRPQQAADGSMRFTRSSSDKVRSRRSSGHLISLRHLPDHHVTRLESGLVVTSLARTAVDLAQRLPMPEALVGKR